jgi:hypothetical protein
MDGFDLRQGKFDLSKKKSSGKMKCVATKNHYWSNGKRKWWITKICDEFKYINEIRTIIGDLSSIKRNYDKVIVENGRSLDC